MSNAAETAVGATDSLLVARKLRAPHVRVGTVSRAKLITAAQAPSVQMVEVTAPAGYGKSTMLAQWASAERRPVAWITLDRHDDDPAILVELIARACAGVSPPVAAILPELLPVGTGVLDRSAPLLAAALAESSNPFVLFLDDVHAAYSPGCRDALEIVSADVPRSSLIVTASRHRQSHLASMRGRLEVSEIDHNLLRFDAADATQLFVRNGIPGDDLDRLVDRCEGWPVGISLAALILRGGGALEDVTGDEHHLADYLHRELLSNLDPPVRDFLRRTAILERLTPRLCDVVGCNDSRRKLEALAAAGIPIDPLDGPAAAVARRTTRTRFPLTSERTNGIESRLALRAIPAASQNRHGLGDASARTHPYALCPYTDRPIVRPGWIWALSPWHHGTSRCNASALAVRPLPVSSRAVSIRAHERQCGGAPPPVAVRQLRGSQRALPPWGARRRRRAV